MDRTQGDVPTQAESHPVASDPEDPQHYLDSAGSQGNGSTQAPSPTDDIEGNWGPGSFGKQEPESEGDSATFGGKSSEKKNLGPNSGIQDGVTCGHSPSSGSQVVSPKSSSENNGKNVQAKTLFKVAVLAKKLVNGTSQAKGEDSENEEDIGSCSSADGPPR